MYDSLVASGLMYGAEIFGFKEREDLEIPQRQFIKWTMGLDKCTKTEIILAESNRFPHYIEMAKRALTYETRISGGTNAVGFFQGLLIRNRRLKNLQRHRFTIGNRGSYTK